MKGKNLIITSLLILVVGILLLCTSKSIKAQDVVIVCSILFILAGIFNVVAFGNSKRKNREAHGAFSTTFNWITSAAAVILGLCMLIFQETFVGLVSMMFGILIAFTAFYQLYVLAIGVRPTVLPAWLYISPAVLVALAIFLFMQHPVEADLKIMLTTGISLSIFGLTGIIEGTMLGNIARKNKATEIKTTQETTTPLDESTSVVEVTAATGDESQRTDNNIVQNQSGTE